MSLGGMRRLNGYPSITMPCLNVYAESKLVYATRLSNLIEAVVPEKDVYA